MKVSSLRLSLATLAAVASTACGGGAARPEPIGIPALPYNEADVHFVTGMISHHAQAVVMAGWAPTHGAGPAVRSLCERILVGQTDEIHLMQEWLADRGQPVPPAEPRPMKMMVDGVERDMLMPGMLNDQQMAELERSRGADFDRLFLTYMIMHHEGAITMVDDLFGSTGAAQDQFVYKFASDVYADQSTEIERMQLMLDGMSPGAPHP